MESLENQLLVAMPSLKDPFFNKTVTYICEHNDQGAMGLIINIPVDISLGELLSQFHEDPEITSSLQDMVYSGGPVAPERGFVLHSPQDCWSSSLALSKDIMITTSKDILMALGTDKQPEKYIIVLGYAGWEAGQLEQEILDNSWLTTPADSDIVFDIPFERRWQKATEKMGIDVAHLSNDVGHA